MNTSTPVRLDLKKDRGLHVEWDDGRVSFFTIAYLRRMSPSADMKQLREQMDTNPLAVLPDAPAAAGGALTALDAELVGRYAVRLKFSDGHSSGLFTWDYLRSIDPAVQPDTQPGPDDG